MYYTISEDTNQMPQYVVSYLGWHCFPMSHWDAKLNIFYIRVKQQSQHIYSCQNVKDFNLV